MRNIEDIKTPRKTLSPLERVHYCPGSAVGSPATMCFADAEKHHKSDVEYLDEMRQQFGPDKYPHWPHIGYDVCPKCSK